MKESKKLQYSTFILMVIACLLHFIQLFLYPLINPKYFITLIGTLAYAIASYGLYNKKEYGYYITICFPIAGAIVIGIVAIFGLSGDFGYGQLNPFTLMAAVVEIPAIILSLYILSH